MLVLGMDQLIVDLLDQNSKFRYGRWEMMLLLLRLSVELQKNTNLDIFSIQVYINLYHTYITLLEKLMNFLLSKS